MAAALEAQACVETLGRGWSIVGAPRPARPARTVQQSVARVVDRYTRLDLVNRFLDTVGQVRARLADAQSWLPLTSLAEWQEFVGALKAVGLRVDADEASAALADLAARLTETPPPPTPRRSWAPRPPRSRPATRPPTAPRCTG